MSAMVGGRLTRLWTLRVRILLALALIAILPLGVVGLGIATLDRRALAEQSARELTGLARGLAGQLEVYLAGLLNDTRAIAALPEIVGMQAGQQDALLKELFHHYPGFARLSTFDPLGQRLASSYPGGALLITPRQSFQTAVRRGHQAWEVAHVLSTGRSSLLINTPIRDADRRVLGVLGAIVDLENVSAVVGGVPVGGGGRAFVLDLDGRVLLHPDRAAVQERHDYSWLGVPTGGRLAGPGTVRYELGGEPLVAGYAPVPNIGWTVVVERPEAEVLTPAERSWHLSLAGLATSAVLSLLTAIFLASTLTRPIRQLAAAARAFGAGEATAPLPSLSPEEGELGALVDAFASMRQAVAGREKAVRESEERYRSLFETNPHPMWVNDVETLAFLAVNDAAVNHYGYAREEFFAMTIKDIGPPEDIPALLEKLAKVPPGFDRPEIWRHHKKDGTIIDVEVTSHGLLFGARQARLVLAHDVTERTRAEAEAERRRMAAESLAEVGRLLSQSLNPGEVGQRIVDSVRALLRAQASALYRLEAGSGELVTLAVSSDVGPAFGRNLVLPWGTSASGLAVRERRPVVTPNVLADPRIALTPEVRADLEQAPFRAVLAVPLILKEQVVGALGIGDQMGRVFEGEEIRLAQAFADQAATALENARLFQATQQAYRELSQTQARLILAQKMEAVGRLAGGIAHDFNNLLTVIIGRAQLLLMRLRPDEPWRREIDLIQQTAQRAAALTGQLLAFSRRQVLQSTVLDLNAVVAEMGQMLRPLIGEDIDLVTELDPSLGRVNADPGQLEQVIMNLVVNARDAMPQGGRLTLETANVAVDEGYGRQHMGMRPGGYVMLALKDTGCGIDADTQSHIFEPFFTTKELGKGTGLGLSTVYGIVTQSGGSIEVDSEPGRGTTFRIYLPRVEERGEEVEPAPSSTRPAKGAETVLLVEDEASVRELAYEILESAGYIVLVACNGPEALQLCTHHAGPIHLLLTDVVMPGMSGPEVARELAPLRLEMQVLYMSGYTGDTLGQYGAFDPSSAFLQKPFTPEGLARKVREVLDARRPAG